MVRIGIVGIGFMGYTHFEGARQLKSGRIAAICTRNQKKLSGDWTGIQGNFGPPAGQVDLKGIKTYTDYNEMFADPDIDLMNICLQTEQHEAVAVAALKAGKNVLVEKPISTDLAGARRMVKAADKAERMLMVAHVLPFFPEFQFAAEAVQSGKYGKLLAAHFRRVIAPPKWSEDMSDFRKLGGWGVDLHIHDNHFITSVLGKPATVQSTGLLRDGLVNHVHTIYGYDGGEPAVSSMSGGIAAKGLEFSHGFELFFENATIQFDAGTYGSGKNREWVVNRPLTVITQTGRVTFPKLKGGDSWCAAFTAELQTAVDAIRTGTEPRLLSGAVARDALQICEAEAKSIASGRPVSVK